MWRQHHIANLLEGVAERSKEVVAVTKDEDGSLKEELEAMKGRNAFGSFYESLRETKEYHLRFPNISAAAGPNLEAMMECKAQFSGPEMFGKYLDLVPFHERSCNLKQLGRTEYVEFLGKFTDLAKVPRGQKTGAYASYVVDLYEYLTNFFARTQPLVDMAEVLAEADERFAAEWAEGTVKGWEGGAAVTGMEAVSEARGPPVAEAAQLGVRGRAHGSRSNPYSGRPSRRCLHSLGVRSRTQTRRPQ